MRMTELLGQTDMREDHFLVKNILNLIQCANRYFTMFYEMQNSDLYSFNTQKVYCTQMWSYLNRKLQLKNIN